MDKKGRHIMATAFLIGTIPIILFFMRETFDLVNKIPVYQIQQLFARIALCIGIIIIGVSVILYKK